MKGTLMATKTPTPDPRIKFIDATTNNLIIDMAKVTMRLRANGAQLQSLRQEVGADKKLREGILDELAKRAIDENQLELPAGHTMESLFAKPVVDEEEGGE
jgi:hypothetical protein